MIPEEIAVLEAEISRLTIENQDLRKFEGVALVGHLNQLRQARIAINEANLSPIQESRAVDALILGSPEQCFQYLRTIAANRYSSISR
jgi:hypothetical protein